MALAHSPKIVTDGLVLCLDAANRKSYPGSGTTWSDLSGRGNNGTLVNTPTYNESGYFSFDWTTQEHATFSNSSSLQFLNRLPYTLEAWIYPTRNPGVYYSGIFDRESVFGAGRDGYNMFFLGSATTDTYFYAERFSAGVQTNAGGAPLNQSVTLNAWHHIVATYDGTTLTLYRNGSSHGTPNTSTGNISNTTKSLTVGVRGNQYFDGRISNAKIYDKSLTASEVRQNFNALRGRYGL